MKPNGRRRANKFRVFHYNNVTHTDFSSWADAAHFMKYVLDNGGKILNVMKL